jgi:hypothetical protein
VTASEGPREEGVAETRARRIAYPLGSGEADILALRAGLKPLVRQLLDRASLDAAVSAFRREGFHVVVSPVRYRGTGRTYECFAAADAPADAEAPVFVSRDPAVLDAAASCEWQEKGDVRPRAIGELLGYPRCCVDAFVSTPPPRPNRELAARAVAAAAGRSLPRLNAIDQAVFHFISHNPCSLACEPSRRMADAVATIVHRDHPAFARAIDEALAAHRLVVRDDVQVSVAGEVTAAGIAVDRVWPTAIDRHPRATLGPRAETAVADLVATLRRGRVLSASGGGVTLDGRPVDGAAGALLVTFGR